MLRPVADEIVVAADARTEADDLGAYAAAADRVIRYEYRGGARDAAWLHRQCSGDWILWIAGDEVPSRTLIEELPTLISSREVAHYWLPTGWLFPDVSHFLIEEPWWPDFHNRLVRNDGTLRFPGLQHSGARPVHPARYLEAPIYHLDLVITTQAQRIAKARRYEASRPGLTCEDGRPLNETYYVPEWHARSVPAAVSPPDRRAIAEVLNASPPALHARRSNVSGSADRVSRRIVTRAEIERWWAPRPLGPDAYRATITPLNPVVRALAGRPRTVFVRVSNEGPEHWPWGGDQPPLIRMGYRLLGTGRASLGEGPRSPLPADLAPGASAIVPVSVTVPADLAPGDYRLEVDLVHENVRWFGRSCSLRLHVAAGDEAAEAKPLAVADDPR